MGLQLTGHKYKYVASQDIVDTDEKYIKELERIAEDYMDYYIYTAEEFNLKTIPTISALKNENKKLKAELHLIKKFLEEAKFDASSESVDNYGGSNTSNIILILSESQHKDALVVDKEITFMSCIIQIVGIL